LAEDYAVVKCEFCGKEEYLPFKCKYCGGYFCIDHRLPENHNCSPVLQIPEEGEGDNSKKGAAKVEKRPREEDVGKNIVPRRIIYDKSSFRAGRLSISKREVAHLFVATVIVLMVVFSSLMYRVFWIFTGWLGGLIFGAIVWMVFSGLLWLVSYVPWLSNFLILFQVDSALWLGLIVVVSFLLHEFAHKFVAQLYDLWAEFRLIFSGVLVTLLSILSPLKFLAPGVVMISGPSHWHTVGKTALSGPLVNLFLGLFLFGLSFIFQNVTVPALFSQVNLHHILLIGASINADIGIFNMLPFGPLDGLKVIEWRFTVWIAVFAMLLAFRVALFTMFSW